jgi:hypothetical protein
VIEPLPVQVPPAQLRVAWRLMVPSYGPVMLPCDEQEPPEQLREPLKVVVPRGPVTDPLR